MNSNAKTLEALIAARATLASGWTQGFYARDVNGDMTSIGDPDATCWCSLGAVYKATVDLKGISRNMLAALNEHMNGSVVDFNDAPGRTQDEVLEAFDKAIAGVKAGVR